jgi:hypothetical protein
MPSPFPGMDPFIEGQEWEDFHTSFNCVVAELLAPRVAPRYVVRIERRVYVEHHAHPEMGVRWADAARISTGGESRGAASPASSGSSLSAIASPVECILPMPEERRETYLVIRERETMEVVTVVESLSPSNKRSSADGRREYLDKRAQVLQSRSHLVELDLLRGGVRPPMITALPPGDYYAIISRRQRRPRAEVYAWGLRQPLPVIPVPLKDTDPDVSLDLQDAFRTVYDRARYGLSLDYAAALDPPLSEADRAWAQELLAARGE